MRILTALVELARGVATTIGRALTKIGEIAGKLTKFLNPKLEKALVKLGVREARGGVAAPDQGGAGGARLRPPGPEHAEHVFDGEAHSSTASWTSTVRRKPSWNS